MTDHLPKEAISARKLADLIRERLDDQNTRVGVFFDMANGWRAVVYASPDKRAEKQKLVDQVASELRTLYDLNSD
jgi:hypothetical protein